MDAKRMNWFENQMEKFEGQQEIYEEFSQVLQKILGKALRSLGFQAIIQARPKEVPSFAEKCLRKPKKSPVDQFTDLCGARVIVETKAQLAPVYGYLTSNFEIDEENSLDALGRLGTAEFGYLSRHYIVSFKEEGADYHGVEVPQVLLERRTEAQAKDEKLDPGPRYKAEVQVRTLLQHAVATMMHDNFYKSDFKAPLHLEREAARIAAKMEDADDSFVRLLEDLHFYRSYYGAYMSSEKIREEIDLYKAVQQHDRDNPKLTHKIARLAMAIDDWPMASRVLEDFRASHAPVSAGILRDLGVALAKQGEPAGQEFLKQAAKHEPEDVDTLCELGDACCDSNSKEALGYYEKAFNQKSSYPRALRSFLQARLLNGDPGIVSLVVPHLEAAIQTCRDWAKVGVYLPWAYYDMGFFALLLGRPYEGLTAYAKAVELSATEAPIQENCDRMVLIQEKLNGKPHELAEAVEWARRFLQAATVAKILALEEAAAIEAAHLEAEVTQAKKKLTEMQAQPHADKEALAEAEKQAKQTGEACAHSRQHLQELRDKAATAPDVYLLDTDPGHKLGGSVATPRRDKDRPIFDKDKPVVIVAGGCDDMVKQRISEYQGLVKFAFAGFVGTVVSGGTQAGISGIVGNLPNPDKAIEKVAYLPTSIPRSDKVHKNYKIYDLPEEYYSPLASIQTWIDILASGVRPRTVKIIGINGGPISAFEYRLGLAMGAKVGILRDSGRAAADISVDPEWQASPGLLILPRDDETVKLFLQPPAPAEHIAAVDKELLARKAHEDHREERRNSLLPADAALAEWDDLIPAFKESSLQQIDHIEAKLAHIGLKLRKVEGREARLFQFKDKKKIEELAKLEHARWNVERILDGWIYGDYRDAQKKISPYLVSWEDLEDDAKKWDRRVVTELPHRLKELGYEIYDPKEESKVL